MTCAQKQICAQKHDELVARCYDHQMKTEIAQHVDAAADAPPSGRVLALVLGCSSLAMLLAAGGLLWWRHGDAVFTEIALSGLAWCF
jgi:hypothetical protein